MKAPCQLSILIAAHNSERFLAATLESIIASLGDSLEKAEIIIVNDASTDSTQTIIDEYARRLPQLSHVSATHRNVGKARNHAVRLASGDYILMVDSDDRLLPGALHERLDTLSVHQPGILLSKIIEVREHTPEPQWQSAEPEELTQHQAIERFLIHRDYQAHFIGQFFSRALLQAHAFPDFICYEDTWLFPLLLTQSRKTLFSDRGFYLYRKHATSLSSAIDEPKIACLIAATQQMDRVLPSHFSPLITCHWIDIANRYHDALRGTEQGSIVRERIGRTSLIQFLLHPKVRLSYKRKMLKVRKRGL
ncbi:glycosyltransferase family 2 protein [Erwinia sp. MMLR14_017]|uniref:glycosyltransferase family 2 protein n=1 Tax=Erwinia sp. MMLR14_017 TaxID=3093842 RepID=UPI00298FD2A4|nr:glycosyltransferase family 2 protein [Erwinia sp. MMLR14_017]MDW8847886.1 glycosyltransferase family 2 protein [Erwinia sp. MMLR14_017]